MRSDFSLNTSFRESRKDIDGTVDAFRFFFTKGVRSTLMEEKNIDRKTFSFDKP